LGLAPLVILMAPVSAFIFFEDKGPVFYNALRLGRDGKYFKMFKFRSMKVNAPDIRNADGSTYSASDDARLTKTGKFLRETSLDELPQLLNVLGGTMSLIGPRPSPIDDLPTYREDERHRLDVRPGISGYCQAHYRNDISCRERRLLDAWYARNVSFGLDVGIVLTTLKKVFKRESVYSAKGNGTYSQIRPEDKEKINS